MSISFNIFPVTTPESIESLTFNAVLPISISGSTEISRPASPTGKPKDERTISAANVAPPPTPATPKELINKLLLKGEVEDLVNAINNLSDLKKIEKVDEVRVVVIKGAAGKIFFAGYDIGLLNSGDATDASWLNGKTLEVQQLMDRVEHCAKPVIGVVDG